GPLVEDLDEGRADPLALDLRVGDSGEGGEEARAGVGDDQRIVQAIGEHRLDLRALVFAEQAVVDKDAVEPLADRPLDERRGDRRVDAAREPADHRAAPRTPARPGPNLLTNALDGL